MNIVLIGCGKVGMYLVEQLLRDKHKLTVIDNNAKAIESAAMLDVMTVLGSGSCISVLKNASVEDCDVMIAVTGSDEVNMLCCLLGKRLGARYTIARVRDTIYNEDIATLRKELELNLTINPEFVTAREIVRMIQFPQVCEIETFCNGRIEMVSLRVEKKDYLCGATVSDIFKHNNPGVLFCVIERGEQTYIPNGSFVIQEDDKLHILGKTDSLIKMFRSLGRFSVKVNNVMIAGGSRISYYLCRELEKLGVRTKLVEIDQQKSVMLSAELPGTMVLNGDGTDQALLRSENLLGMDAFISLTNRDEDNLISALYAMQNGVSKVIAKNNRTHYAPIIRKLGFEGMISPKVVTGNHIMQFVRGLENSEDSEMLNLYQIAGGKAEAMEFHLTGEARHLGVKLKDVPTLNNVIIAAIIRGTQIIIPSGETQMLAGDNVVIVTADLNVKQFDDIFSD